MGITTGWKRAVALLLLSAAIPALAGGERDVLPVPHPPFTGTIAENALDARPSFLQRVEAPAGAPNILVFMSDDTGFAMPGTFGGAVPTPNLDKLARAGQRYNRFHTTGICSPSRAALLTGRNHHNVGNGYLSDMSGGFPGYRGFISPETATIAQTLRLNGYSTAMFGKHHNIPPGEEGDAGPFDNWPTGLGFEYFYGFVHGDTDQFSPNLYRGTNRVDPDEGGGALLDKRLADDIIRWVHNQKAAAPDKPFFIYYAPGSTHAPHQAPAEYITKFKGRFDQGWDRMREDIFREQLKMGIVPAGTTLTPRPPEIPAWSSLSPEQKAFAARAMEVAAAQLAYQDAQIGRVLDELQRMGQLENTLVILVQGDNGASAEVGLPGSINEMGVLINRIEESPQWLASNIERMGGPETYPTYPAGWAWAMNTPFRWTKQYASMLGGIRNGMIMSWPARQKTRGSICSEFGHLVDIAPTALAAAGVKTPTSVYGVQQKPLDGQNLLPSLSRCTPDRPRTQYFELGGKIGFYHDGWFATNDDGRLPWQRIGPKGERPETEWRLYDLRKDFSQSRNIAAAHPAKMQELVSLWQDAAEKNGVFPIDYRFISARMPMRPSPHKKLDFWGKNVSITLPKGPAFVGRSFTLGAQVRLDKAEASGAVIAAGSRFGGWSLYLDKGRPAFTYAGSTNPGEILQLIATDPLPAGETMLGVRFVTEGLGKPGMLKLLANESVIAEGRVPRTLFGTAGLGETLDVGRDLGVTVVDYVTRRGELEGDVPHAAITFDD